MKFKRRILSLLLTLLFLFTPPVSARAAGESDLIRQMINYFRYHQEAAHTDLERLLIDLEDISPEKAAQWESIMADWLWTETELNYRSGELPDGLPDDNSLCIVVLGYHLTSGGQMRSELRGRMDVALRAAQQYPNAYIMVTGGATASNNKKATEAGRMAAYLRNSGIDSSRIIQETKSYSTEANAINCLKILNHSYPQVQHLVLITSDYHMQFSYMLFAARQQLNYGGSMDMVGAACYYTGKSGSFGISSQANALASLAGVKVSNMKSPSLSQLSSLAVLRDTVYRSGDPLNLTVTAHFTSGYSKDVTEEAEFSSFDPHSLGTQTVTVTYTEGGITVSGEVNILVEEQPVFDPLPDLPQSQTEWLTETAELKQSPAISPWWCLLGIPALWGLYELRQRKLRKQRRRQRRRRKMNLE